MRPKNDQEKKEEEEKKKTREERDASWRKLEGLGLRQYGVVTVANARACKVGRAAFRWRVGRGQLVKMHEGVFRLSGSKETWDQRAWAVLAWLGSSAALSHASAASLHCLDGFKTRPAVVEVLVPADDVHPRRLKALPALVKVHRTRATFETVTVAGLRMTDLTRTLIDLARILKEPRGLEDALEDALDSAQRMYPGTDRELEATLKSGTRGKKGGGRLKRLLDERGGHATESPLEVKVFRALRLAKLPRPAHQTPMKDSNGYLTRLDFAWPVEKVALHVDSYQYHQQRKQFERDRLSATRLTGLDWHSIWVTDRMLKDGAWIHSLRTVLEARAPQRKLF